MIQYYFYKIGQFFVQHLPLTLSYKLAIFLSDIHYYLSFRDRRSVKNNLKAIVPPTENVAYLSKEMFRNFARYLVDFFYVPGKLNEAYIKEHVTIKNLHYLPEVLRHGKGAIILTAHIGNWELGGFIISKLGYPMIAVALPHKERSINNLFNQQRQSQGITIVPNNVGIRGCVKGLKENRIIALLGDRDFNATGEMMDFLGKKARMPKGPAAFSLKTGAPIIPAFLTRDMNDRFTLIFEEPIFPLNDPEDSRALKTMMKKYIEKIEKTIRQFPTQWYMFQRFWL